MRTDERSQADADAERRKLGRIVSFRFPHPGAGCVRLNRGMAHTSSVSYESPVILVMCAGAKARRRQAKRGSAPSFVWGCSCSCGSSQEHTSELNRPQHARGTSRLDFFWLLLCCVLPFLTSTERTALDSPPHPPFVLLLVMPFFKRPRRYVPLRCRLMHSPDPPRLPRSKRSTRRWTPARRPRRTQSRPGASAPPQGSGSRLRRRRCACRAKGGFRTTAHAWL